jgi:hypothetical protein
MAAANNKIIKINNFSCFKQNITKERILDCESLG